MTMPHENTPSEPPSSAALRQQAEAALRGTAAPTAEEPAALSPGQVRAALHELRVHQIELEMQNEELRRAQQELDAARARYFDLFDLAPVGYVTVGESGLILEANLTVANLLGEARGALLQQPLSRFIFKADRDAYFLLRKQFVASPAAEIDPASEPQARELRVVKSDGTLVWVLLAASAVQDAGGATVCRVVLSDITARKQAEEARNQLAYVLDGKNRELGNLVRATSESLRSTLLNIQGYSARIGTGCQELVRLTTAESLTTDDRSAMAAVIAGELPRSVECIQASVDKMDQLLGGMVRLSRLGRTEVKSERLDVEEIVHRVVRVLRYQHRLSEGFVEVEKLPPCRGDPDQVSQLFTHLIENALKFGDRVRPLRVTVSGRVEQGRAIYCVADTGLGIAPAYRERIWDLFFRVNSHEAAPGEGIGLALVQRIVERHQGSIRVESTLGEGSRFYVTLPLGT